MANESKTRNCPYCKEEIKVDAIKCKHCGTSVAPEKPGHEGTCPYCKEQIHPEAIKCKHCKTDLRPTRISEGRCDCGGRRGVSLSPTILSAARGIGAGSVSRISPKAADLPPVWSTEECGTFSFCDFWECCTCTVCDEDHWACVCTKRGGNNLRRQFY